MIAVRPGRKELRLRIDRTKDLRSAGWVTADTHVHFLSPQTAWLEAQGEGVNVVNLLASQWGRLFTNVGDYTGRVGVFETVAVDKKMAHAVTAGKSLEQLRQCIRDGGTPSLLADALGKVAAGLTTIEEVFQFHWPSRNKPA